MIATLRGMILVILMLPAGCSSEHPALVSPTPAASQSTVDECTAIWNSMADIDRAGIEVPAEDLLAEWRKRGGRCKGTGVFELHLASIYLASGDAGAARQAVKGVTAQSEEYAAEISALLLQMDLEEAIAKRTERGEVTSVLDPRFALMTQQFGRYCSVKGAEAGYQLYVRRYAMALKGAEDAIQCDPKAWKWRRLAAAAAWKAEAYERIRPQCAAGVDLNRTLMSDPGFMLACAAGYGHEGRFSTASDVLSIIRDRSPAVKESGEYQQVQAYIAQQAALKGKPWPPVQ